MTPLGFKVRMLLRDMFRFCYLFGERFRKVSYSESPEMKRALAEFDKFERENPERVRKAEERGRLRRQMFEEANKLTPPRELEMIVRELHERWHKAVEEARKEAGKAPVPPTKE